MLKKFIIGAVAAISLFAGISLAYAAPYVPFVGGTGTSTTPVAGGVVAGNGTSICYTPTSTNGFVLIQSSTAPCGVTWVLNAPSTTIPTVYVSTFNGSSGAVTGVSSFTGAGCATASNTTGTVALTVTCISGNQTITFIVTGDATGTASGATSITDSIKVTGLNGVALPANTTGTLQFSGGSWQINLATSSLGVYDVNGKLSSFAGSTTSGSGNCLTSVTISASGTLSNTNSACSGGGGGGGVASTTPFTVGGLVTVSSSGALATIPSSTYYLATNPSNFISTSTGLTTANFTSGNISQWTNNSGYLTTSTALTTANFASANISQWTNNSGYLTTSTYNASTSISVSGPITGGGSIVNGGTVNIACATCLTANQSITWTGTGDVTGSASGATTISVALTTVKIQGKSVTSTAPTDHQFMTWVGANSDWEGGNLVAGTGLSSATSTSSSTSQTLSVNQAATLSFSVLGNTTSTGNVSAATLNASSSITNQSVKNALVLNSAAGLEGAYGGSSCTNQGVSAVSATGTVTCTTFTTSTNPGTVTTSSVLIANTIPIATSGSALGNSNISQPTTTSTVINSSSTCIGGLCTGPSSLVWVASSSITGYWDATGTIPAISSCGTSPTSTGNQWRSRITVGSIAATGCTETFPISFVKIPSCIVDNESMSITSALTYTVSTSTLVISQATGLVGDNLDIDCVGQSE